MSEKRTGGWIAEIPELPGVMAYGSGQAGARRRGAALRGMADRIEAEKVGQKTISLATASASGPVQRLAGCIELCCASVGLPRRIKVLPASHCRKLVNADFVWAFHGRVKINCPRRSGTGRWAPSE